MDFRTLHLFYRARWLSLAVLLLVLPIGTVHAQTTYHVAPSGDDTNAGTSWDAPFQTLTKALTVATGADAIWLAEGTYYPDEGPGVTDDDPGASFTLTQTHDGIEIYGGFAVGDAFADRDPAAHPVLLSGDIDQNDAPFAPTEDTDDDPATRSQVDHQVGANAETVVLLDPGFFDETITLATLLDGLAITGSSDGSGSFDSAMYCDGGTDGECSPTLRGLVFYGNFADEGGGLYNDGSGSTSSPTLINCVFVGNAAGNEGGALYNDGEGGVSSPTIVNTTFTLNAAFGAGAILNNGQTGVDPGESQPVLTNVLLYGNQADSDFSNDEIGNSFATPVIQHSLIQDSGGSSSWDDDLGTDGGGNIDADPLFSATDDLNGSDDMFGTMDDGLRLADESPALDAGTNAPFASGGVAETVTTDVTGATRLQDDDDDNTATVDIGAYEGGAGPIPVELTAFDVFRNGAAVALTWETASETNNAGFQVERSVDDGAFQRLAFVDGAGTTNTPQRYRFSDRDVPAGDGSITYRLRQVDLDGTEHLSAPVTIALDDVQSLTLEAPFPNPMRSTTTLRYTVPAEGHISITVHDLLGRQVGVLAAETKRSGSGTVLLNADRFALASGTYFVRLQASGQSVTQRLTVVR